MINEEKATHEEIEMFNCLCEKLIPVTYSNPVSCKNTKLEMSLGQFLIVNSLRNLSKSQLKKLFHYIGLKQTMKISSVSTKLCLESFVSKDFEKKSSPWKVVIEGNLND